MKKTLFLTAVLGAALCSGAHGATQTVTIGGATYEKTSVVTGNLSENPGGDYILFAAGSGQDLTISNTTNNWAVAEEITQTFLVSPATLADESTTTGCRLLVNNATVYADIIAGGSASDDIRLNGAKSVLKGSLTIADSTNNRLQVWSQENTQYIEGAINGSGKTLAIVGNNNTIRLSGGATLGTLTTSDQSVHVVLDNKKSDGTTAAASTTYNINTVSINNAITMKDGVTLNLNGGFEGKLIMEGSSSITSNNSAWVRLKNGSSVRNLSVQNLDFQRNSDFTVEMFGTNTITDQIDLAGSPNIRAGIKLMEGATLSASRLWLYGGSRGITLQNNAVFTCEGLTITGLSNDTLGSLTREGTASSRYFKSDTNVTIAHAAVAVTNPGNVDVELKNILTDVDLTYTNTTASKTLKLYGNNTLNNVSIGNGARLTIADGSTDISGTVALNDVTIESEKKLTFSGSVDKTINGIISGAGMLKMSGSGTLSLGGQNTYTGGTVVESGTLKLTKEDGGEAGQLKGSVTVKSGATLDLAGNDSLGWGTNSVSSLQIEEGGKLFVSAAGNRTGGGKYNQTFQKMAITLTGATISGNEGATIDLYNSGNVAGNYTTLTVNAADGATAANPTVSTADSNVTLRLRQSSTTITVAENASLVIANGLKKNGGTPALVKAGAGSMTLGAASDYDGGTTISEGTVIMGNAASLGTGAVSIASGATLDVNGNTIANAITTAGNIVNNGSALYSLNNGLQNVTLSGNAVIGGSKAISMVKNGGADTAALAMGGHTLTVSNDKGLYMNKTTVTGGGSINVTKGEIVFFGSVSADSTGLNLNNGTKLMINADSAIGGLTGSGIIGVAVADDKTQAKNDSTLTINTGTSDKASSATINGENHLTIKKQGTGSQSISGTVSGLKGIQVEAGDLTVVNPGTAPFALESLQLDTDTTITLGSATEGGHDYTLALESLTVNGNATMNAHLNMTSGTITFADNAVLTMGCNVTLTDSVTIALSSDQYQTLTTLPAEQSITLFDGVDGYNGPDIIHVVGAGAEQDGWFFLNYTPGEQGGTLSLVPEPTTATLSLLALAALAARRRRH